MSSPEADPIRLSARARQDLIDILRFTGETWGRQQIFAYRDKIDAALQAISRNPRLGHRRSDLPGTHRAYLVSAHIIVYRPEKTHIGIVRILHQRMSPPGHRL